MTVSKPGGPPFSSLAQFVGLAAAGAGIAVLTQVPRLWGIEALWQHAFLVSVVVVTPCFYVGASQFDRWSARRTRREPTNSPSPKPPPVAVLRDDALARVRRSVTWYRWRRFLFFAVVLGVVGFYFVASGAEQSDQRLIDEQPHRTATVVEVHRSPFDRPGDSPDVTVEIDGHRVELGNSFPDDGNVHVGDNLVVVADPNDHDYVVAANSHDDWAYSPWFGILLTAVLGAIPVAIATVGLPWRAPLVRVRDSGIVTMCSIASRPLGGGVLRAPGGDEWQVDRLNGPRLRSGPVTVVGALAEGSWVALVADDGVAWTRRPLTAAQPRPPART